MTIIERVQITAPLYGSNPNLNLYITMATEQTSACFYGELYDQAVALLTCHLMYLALGGSGGSPGAVNRKSESRASIGFASSGVAGNLGSSSYGVQLDALRKQCGISIRTIGVNQGCK